MISEAAKSKLRRLLELRQDKDVAEQAFNSAKAAFRELEAEVVDQMEEDGVEGTLKVDLGAPWGVVAFRTRETIYARVVDEHAALKWFEERMMVDEVSVPKWAKGRLNAIVREHREQGLPLPPGLDYLPNRGVTITRQK